MLLQIQAAQGDVPPINQSTMLASLLLAAKKANETPLEPLQFVQASDEAASPEPEGAVPSRNRAVQRCILAYNTALALARERKKDAYDSRKAAKHAYREAFPPLMGRKNVRDFIACVAYAMLTEIMTASEGTRFLYAARVATQVQETRSHHARQKTSPKAPPKRPLSRQKRPSKP